MTATVYVTLESSVIPMTDDDGEGNPLTDAEALTEARARLIDYLLREQRGEGEGELAWDIEREEL